MQTLGQQIRQAREVAGLTQQALADLCGWHNTNQSAIENDREVVGRERLEKLSRALGGSFNIAAGGVQFVVATDAEPGGE